MRYPSGAFNCVLMGDSQTLGYPGVDGWRPGLAALLAPELAITYVGTVTDGVVPTNHFSGIGGTTSVFWQQKILDDYGPGKIRAAIWRLMLGANDLANGLDAGFGASMAQCLANVKTVEPRAVVSVATVQWPAGDQVKRAAMNVALAVAVLAARAGGQVVELEPDPGITAGDCYPNEAHFLPSGNAKLAITGTIGIVRALVRAGY